MGQYQREFEVLLPVGYTDATGRCHRQAVLRKMRGHEESLLYDATLTAGRLVTALLSSCLLRLGELEPVETEVVSQLYTADRNYLLLELRRLTLGNGLPTSYSCPHCAGEVAVLEDLSQVEVHRLAEGEALADIQVELEDGYVDREGKLHTDLVLTLPQGVDEEFVSPMITKDPHKAQDALLLRCIKKFGTLPKAALEAYGVKILRDLTMGDRWRLRQTLDDMMPGVSLQRTIKCDHCGNSFTGIMDVSHFFVLS